MAAKQVEVNKRVWIAGELESVDSSETGTAALGDILAAILLHMDKEVRQKPASDSFKPLLPDTQWQEKRWIRTAGNHGNGRSSSRHRRLIEGWMLCYY